MTHNPGNLFESPVCELNERGDGKIHTSGFGGENLSGHVIDSGNLLGTAVGLGQRSQ